MLHICLRVVNERHDHFSSVVSLGVVVGVVWMRGVGGMKFEYLSANRTPMFWPLLHNKPRQLVFNKTVVPPSKSKKKYFENISRLL